jgi:hypothetical protein
VSTEPEQLTEQEVYYEEEMASGWALFAAMMLFGVSLFSFMSMCIGWGVPDIIKFSAFGMRVDWLWYGLFDGLVAIVAFIAAGAVLQGRKFGYYAGLIIATLSAGRWFLYIPGVPFWGLMMVVVWILVIYGLTKERAYFK